MAVKLELLFTDLKVFLTLLFSDSNVYYGIVLGLIFGILTGWIVRGKFSKQTTEDSCDGRKVRPKICTTVKQREVQKYYINVQYLNCK